MQYSHTNSEISYSFQNMRMLFTGYEIVCVNQSPQSETTSTVESHGLERTMCLCSSSVCPAEGSVAQVIVHCILDWKNISIMEAEHAAGGSL